MAAWPVRHADFANAASCAEMRGNHVWDMHAKDARDIGGARTLRARCATLHNRRRIGQLGYVELQHGLDACLISTCDDIARGQTHLRIVFKACRAFFVDDSQW